MIVSTTVTPTPPGADAPVWDLDAICLGGVGGAAFLTREAELGARIANAGEAARGLGAIGDARHGEGWSALLLELDRIEDEVAELASLTVCTTAADALSQVGRAASARIDDLVRQRSLVEVTVNAAIDAADDAGFEALAGRPELGELAPRLRYLRAGRALRLAPALQALKVEMDREALTAWGRLYDQIAGELTGRLDHGGTVRTVGVAELAAMRAEPDPSLRRAAFDAAGAAWGGVKGLCAHALTQIVGNRQQHADRLGVGPLASTLYDNRLDEAVLDAMAAASDAARPALVRYLAHKGRLLGRTDGKIDWCDVDAPLPGAGAGADADDSARWSWDAATRGILAAFDGFHPTLGGFAREALHGGWIDARPRAGRSPGGFCTGFPRARQSRIFMTFVGSLDNATTLAHELGHAYHNRVLDGQVASRTHLTSALAETASTFAEAVFRDHVLAGASDPAFRAYMLDQQLQAAAAFLMDIPHRFAFERRLYALRREGVFDPDALSAACVNEQERAYGGVLAEKSPLFWCSKLHYYIPDFGFYNWPYQFGYLFSAAVHARAKAAGPAFLATLDDLLLRTGWQDSVALARDTLGVDLRSPAFWREAAAPIDGWVDAFVQATSPTTGS